MKQFDNPEDVFGAIMIMAFGAVVLLAIAMMVL
jgi:hypothetical protein